MFHIVRPSLTPTFVATQPFLAQIFRHGESESNAGLRTQSAHGPQLTPLGRRQADEIAQNLVRAPALFVLSSYVRTHQTAAPSIFRYPSVPVEIWPIHEFTYLSGSRYDGTTSAERSSAVEGYWNRCDPQYLDGDQCETFQQFLGRVDEFILRLHDHSQQEIAIFSHGHVLRAVMLRLTEREKPLSDLEAMREYATKWRHEPVFNGERFMLYRKPPRERLKILHH